MIERILRKLSALELMEIRRECAKRSCGDETERALFSNAALLAKALSEDGEALFRSADEVLSAWSIGEINRMIGQYAALEDGEELFLSVGTREAAR